MVEFIILWTDETSHLHQTNKERVWVDRLNVFTWSTHWFCVDTGDLCLCRYYLFALILSLTRDVYELRLLMESEARYRASKSPPSPYPSTASPADNLSSPASPVTVAVPIMSARLRRQLHLLVTVLYNNPPLLLDLLKNSCDIFIPLDRLGIYSTGSGFVGACGLVSSILSIITMVHPWLKLKPWTHIQSQHTDGSVKAELDCDHILEQHGVLILQLQAASSRTRLCFTHWLTLNWPERTDE